MFSVGYQIMESLRKHMHMNKAAARQRAQELLELVGIPDAQRAASGELIRTSFLGHARRDDCHRSGLQPQACGLPTSPPPRWT